MGNYKLSLVKFHYKCPSLSIVRCRSRYEAYLAVSVVSFIPDIYAINKFTKGLGAIRANIGPISDVDKIFSKMYSQYVLFRNKYS
jgi:hypothetical protein